MEIPGKSFQDKWRNLSVAPGSQGSRDKVRTPKVKAAAAAVMAAAAAAATITATPNTNSSPAVSLPHSASSDLSMDDNCLNIVVDVKNAPRYDGMIFEALSALADANGSDISAILSFIEQKRHEVPQNFRRILGSRLRRLAAQGKLEKVQNLYKISDPSGTRTPASRQKETNLKPRQSNSQGPTVSQEMVEEAAITAAYKVVEAENKVDVAKGAVEELERMTRVAEDTDVFLEIVKEIHERCSHGEVVLLA